MAFCLPRESSKRFLEALRAGKIVPENLLNMSSAERRSFFEQIVGKENAREVNAQLEAKIILKDQKRGMVTWAKKLSGISEATRKDLISAIERLDKILEPKTEKAFLEDLVAKKLGTEVTFEEAKQILTLAKDLKAKKEAIPEDSPIRGKERMEYAASEALFGEYIDALKTKDPRSLPKIITEFLTSPSAIVKELASAFKSLNATLDDSFSFIQGLPTLFTNSLKWATAFGKSWEAIVKELAGIDTKNLVRGDVISRPNALNGKYEIGKFDLGLRRRIREEAFPGSLIFSLIRRIPIAGRVFRAAEAAFNSFALRLRADLADGYIAKMEKQGIDTSNPTEMVSIGKVVNSVTGRGDIGKLKILGEELNVALFSVRFFKGTWDTLTAHLADRTLSPFARKQAALNLAKIVTGISSTLFIADQLWPGSVEWDPTSSKSGKICQPGTKICFNVAGGFRPIVTTAARLTPHKHKGEWGLWYKTSKGKFIKLNSGKFGTFTAWDMFTSFWENKTSPIARTIIDVSKGQNFAREKPTVTSITRSLITPISVQQFFELKKNENEKADIILAMILEGLGISPTDYESFE